MASFFGIEIPIPTFSLPSLPKLPQITLPNFSLPSLPKIDLPKVSLPALPKISLPSLPKIDLPSLPGVSLPDFSQIPNLPKNIVDSGSAAVSALNLAAQGILPIGMKAGTKAAQQYIAEQTRLAQWAADAAAGAVGAAGAALPKVELPKVELPKVELPKVELPKVELPKVEIPKIELPKVSLPDIAKVAPFGLVALPVAAGAAAAKAVLPELPRVELPDVGAAAGGVSRWYDDVIAARDKSYEDSAAHIAAGNVAGGAVQFGGTMAADVILPMDFLDAANKWATGRGDQIDTELALWAAIDAVSLAAAPFTFGASYAAARALKAGKLAKAAGMAGKITKTVQVGGEVSKGKAVSNVLGALLGAGGKAVPKTAPKATTSVSSLLESYAKAIPKAAPKPKVVVPKATSLSSLESYAKVAPKTTQALGSTKALGVTTDLIAAESKWAKTSSVLGSAAKTTGVLGVGLGAGAIGLTMMGGLGGPAPIPGQEETEEEEELPQWLLDLLSGGGATTGGDGGQGFPWGDYQYPDGEGGYTDEYGYYPPAYPDFLGLEGYGQDLLGYAEDLPVVGGVYEGASRRGLAVPAIIGTIILVILVVAFLRGKKGKKMIGSVKKTVSGAVGGVKKAVMG